MDRTLILGNKVIGAGANDNKAIRLTVEVAGSATIDSTLIAKNQISNCNYAFSVARTTNTTIARNTISNIGQPLLSNPSRTRRCVNSTTRGSRTPARPVGSVGARMSRSRTKNYDPGGATGLRRMQLPRPACR